MTNSIPETYRAVQLDAFGGSLTVVEKSMPKLNKGQVLVKMAMSPINPSDLSMLEGNYGLPKETPLVPGLEGSGTVVASGGGMVGQFMLGKRVAVLASSSGDGVWAEYVLTDATSVLPLHKDVSLEQGAMSMVNPLTAYVLLDIAKKSGNKALVHTAAASQLGRMMNQMAHKQGIEIINVVRRAEQVELLKGLGAKHVLNSSDADFDTALKALAAKLDAHVGFDAVAGELSVRVLQALPNRSTVYIYGGLSGQPSLVDPRNLLFEDKTLKGFWLSSWARQQPFWKMLITTNRVQKMLAGGVSSKVQGSFPLSQAQEAVETYQNDMTAGKVLILGS